MEIAFDIVYPNVVYWNDVEYWRMCLVACTGMLCTGMMSSTGECVLYRVLE